MSNVFQKIFATVGFGAGGRIPIRTNIMNFGHSGSGYSMIGGASARFQNDRQSAILGNDSPSNRITGWLSRVAELKGYENIDTCKLAVSLFEDYTNNFLNTQASQIITILDEEGNEDEQKTQRINDILIRDIKIFDFIRDHLRESIYYGCYYSLLRTKRDEKGHLRFFPYELYDPISVIIRKNMDPETNEIVDEYIAMGEDGEAYVIPDDECFYMGSPNMRLRNDIKDSEKSGFITYENPNEKGKKLKFGNQENRKKVMMTESYTAGEPIFYSNILKVKELVVKELLVSLLTLRDLTTPSLLALMFDKGVPIESAQELCTRVQRMLSSYNDLSSFLSSQFDVTSLIENILSQNIKVIPDYNATLQNKGLINTDKLSDKLMEIMQTLDQSRQQVLSTIGVPSSIMDGTLGNKWQILQSSERASSKTLSIITGLKESLKSLVRTIYKVIYGETIDPDLIRIHAFSKTTVEYNNSMNTMENVSSLTSGISNVLVQALQTLDQSMPLLDPKAYIGYIRNLIKDIDPEAVDLITDDTIEEYIKFANEKYQAQRMQLGLE